MVAAFDMPVTAPDPVPSFASVPRTARIPVDEITARARTIRPGHALLTVIGGLLFCAAWIVARAFGAAWLVLTWCFAACATGWADARGKGPSKSALQDENAALRMAVRRLGGEA